MKDVSEEKLQFIFNIAAPSILLTCDMIARSPNPEFLEIPEHGGPDKSTKCIRKEKSTTPPPTLITEEEPMVALVHSCMTRPMQLLILTILFHPGVPGPLLNMTSGIVENIAGNLIHQKNKYR